MYKAKVNNQLLACAITSFMWMWSECAGKNERIVFVAEIDLRSDLRVYDFSWQKSVIAEVKVHV